MADDSKVSKYDIYQNKNTGEIMVYSKGGKGEGTLTGIVIKKEKRNL